MHRIDELRIPSQGEELQTSSLTVDGFIFLSWVSCPCCSRKSHLKSGELRQFSLCSSAAKSFPGVSVAVPFLL
jgi:hypothetical protein